MDLRICNLIFIYDNSYKKTMNTKYKNEIKNLKKITTNNGAKSNFPNI